MYPTSAAYKTAISLGARVTNTRVHLGIYDLVAKTDADISASSSQSFCDTAELKDNVNLSEYNVASFEDNLFKLDGNFYLMPDNATPYFLGWWSGVMSDSSGVFGTPPVITILFDDLHSCAGIEIYFDLKSGVCAKDFVIKWYNGVTLLDTETITNNVQSEFRLQNAVSNYNKIEITIQKTNLPYRYVRIMEINFGLGLTLEGSEVVEARIIEETDPISNMLSINTLNLKLINTNQNFNMLNPSGVYSQLQTKQPIIVESSLKLQNGTYESVPIGTYYLSKWENATGLTASFEATDLIGFLDKEIYYKSPFWTNESLYNVIQHILNDAGSFPFALDYTLQNILVTGYIPAMSHREALQTILFAVCASLRYERTGMFYIFRPDYSVIQKSVGKTLIIGDPKIELKQLISAVRVESNSYNLLSSVQLYSETKTLVGTETYIIPYKQVPAINVSANISGAGTIQTEVYSSTTAFVTIQATGDFTLTINGQPYEAIKNIFEANNGPLGAGELYQVAKVEENTLISSDTQAQFVAQYLLNYYNRRIKQEVDYWCDPSVQAGDNISFETMFGDYYNGIIERQELEICPSLKSKVVVI